MIQASSPWRGFQFAEVWEYRELLYFLALRDLRVRFKQTLLGVAWLVLRPLLSIAVFTVVFGRLAQMPSDGIPYPLFLFAAMLPWNFFAGAVGASTASLVANANLVSKVYFPRVIIVMAAVFTAVAEAAISLGLIVAMMAWYGRTPPISAIASVPLLLLLTMGLALAVGLWLGTLNVRYRDVGNAISFLLQIWMYLTPVLYPLSVVPERYQPLLALNPLTGVVEGYRAALFGSPWLWWPLAASVLVGIVVFLTGLLFFSSSDHLLADTV